MWTYLAASATCSRGGAIQGDLGQGAGVGPPNWPVGGIPGAPAGRDLAARRQGNGGQARSDSDPGTQGGPSRLYRSDAGSSHGRGVRGGGARSGDESHGASLRRGPLELREADEPGESTDQRGHGKGSSKQHHYTGMRRPGFFVVLEGPEGSGKSTLLGPLAERMRAVGIEPVVVREPGSTRTAEIARQALLDPEHPVSPLAELFLYLAARADLVQTVIEPALAAGRVVLSDRFALTTEAYQMAGRKLDANLVRAGNHAATHGLRPDLTLIIDLAPEIGLARQVAAGK